MNYFCIYDTKAQAFTQPFHAPSRADAIRQVTMMTDDGKSLLSRFPQDYQLMSLGEFDKKTGHFNNDVEHVANVFDLKEVKNVEA